MQRKKVGIELPRVSEYNPGEIEGRVLAEIGENKEIMVPEMQVQRVVKEFNKKYGSARIYRFQTLFRERTRLWRRS